MAAGELVAGDQPGLVAPALEQHVDVRSADAAVVDLDQHLARSGPGHRPLLDHHLARPPVDRRRHHLGQIGHDVPPPSEPAGNPAPGTLLTQVSL